MEPDLPAAGILENLSDDERAQLKSYGEFIPVQADQHVIEQGADQDSLYLVVSGSLEIYMKPGDRKVVLGKVSAGQCVGEVNIFDPQKASASVEGTEFSQVWRVDHSMLESFLNDNPAVGAKVLIGIAKALSGRVRKTNEMISRTRDVLPQLSETLREVKDAITEAQEGLPGLIAMS